MKKMVLNGVGLFKFAVLGIEPKASSVQDK
jgi:hypothetical protein